MNISDVKRGMSNISLKAKVIDISEPREVNTRFGVRNVADATLEDETGQISLSLWQEQIERVKVGNTVNLSGAFVTEFRGKLQLSIPKSGKMEIEE
ncbi:MAG TPA: DNA-binding protein [archaeon]|nr:DNA-binding protein [archaeon]